MAALPEAYPYVLSEWNTEDLSEMEGSGVKVKVEAWKAQVVTDFHALHALRNSTCENSLGAQFPWFTLDAYKWALYTIFSRCVSVRIADGTGRAPALYKALAPFFDLFNHSPRSLSQHGLTPVTWTPSGAALVVTTGQSWAKGEEVCLNYGLEPNGRLLLLYGFVVDPTTDEVGDAFSPSATPPPPLQDEDDTSSPSATASTPLPPPPPPPLRVLYDEVDLVAPLPPNAPDYEQKRQILEQWALGGHVTGTPFKLTPSEPVPEGLLRSVRVHRAEGPELIAVEAGIEGTPLSQRQWPVSLANEAMVLAALKMAFSGMLAAYPTSADDDASLLAGAVIPGGDGAFDLDAAASGEESGCGTLKVSLRKRMALIVRSGEKRILELALEELENRQENLESLTPEDTAMGGAAGGRSVV
eukprot:CAMPEP_0185755172 /NCGR_PEP_ID=MMETSP1174-20130828/13695_1 /TAXON_ID=35687 /ORGANISM="Dictyocha speculum, Strain CCMP1381" /LENGTH=413 /DNA_ID=CAMNT_0028433621 /DNA_START=1 /DNA_END=1242 /DNA_ORIENTATION=-